MRFYCVVNGTSDTPHWIINGIPLGYPLPERHIRFGRSLKVTNVHLSDNGTTYQCSLHVIFSETAILIVRAMSPKTPQGNKSPIYDLQILRFSTLKLQMMQSHFMQLQSQLAP